MKTGSITKSDKPDQGVSMSLSVSSALLDKAAAGPVTDDEFVDCIRTSLPYAWDVVSRTAAELARGDDQFVTDNTDPPSVEEQGQLLRALASSSMRSALERHFGMKLEFQNCCKVAAFRVDAVGGEAHTRFVSPRMQLLNQAPGLLSC
jgi:uncharacterized protein